MVIYCIAYSILQLKLTFVLSLNYFRNLHSSVTGIKRIHRLALVGHRGVLMMLWPPRLPPDLKACIPLHVPVTNHHTDLVKNRVAEPTGNIKSKLSRVSPVLSKFISHALTQKMSVLSASVGRNWTSKPWDKQGNTLGELFKCSSVWVESRLFPHNSFHCACTNRLL